MLSHPGTDKRRGIIETAGSSSQEELARRRRCFGQRLLRVTLAIASLTLSWARAASAADDVVTPQVQRSGEPDTNELIARPPRRDLFALDLSAATLVPLSMGPELSVELPGRVLAQAHLGWMPDVYSNAITGTLEDAGVYDETVGALVDGAFEGAQTWRFGVGWRPFSRLGLELGVSYARVALDGRTTTGELIPLVPQQLAEEIESRVGDSAVDLDSTIHHVMIGAGWRWLIAERLVIRANISYLQAFASSSELDLEAAPALGRLATPIVNDVLHDHYMQYVKLPVVGLSVGYRFF